MILTITIFLMGGVYGAGSMVTLTMQVTVVEPLFSAAKAIFVWCTYTITKIISNYMCTN